VLFRDGLRSLVAQQIRNFAAANNLNLFLLACALIFNLSEALLHRRRGGPGHQGIDSGSMAAMNMGLAI